MTVSPLANVTATREVLDAFGLSTKKALGQHFLIDDNVVRKIVELAGFGAEDTLLEVGPGIGTLTVALLAQAGHVISIERDADLPQVLASTCSEHADRFTLVEADALQVGPEELARVCEERGVKPPSMLVSNLPYAVAATVVLQYFETLDCLQSATVMVQSEVADRMAAQLGTKDYGAYSVKLGMFAEPAGRFEVSPRCFFPPPHVGSAVIKLERRTPTLDGEPASRAIIDAACAMADAAFTQRRKNVRNSLNAYFSSRGMGKELADQLLESVGIAPTVRGETLDHETFLRLGVAYLELTE